MKFSSQFNVTLDVIVDSDTVKDVTHTWDTLRPDKLAPLVCFSSEEEFLACQEEFGKPPRKRRPPATSEGS